MFWRTLRHNVFVSIKFLLKSFANAYDFRGRNVGFKTLFFYLLSLPILGPRGTRKDFIYMLSKYYDLPHVLTQEEKSLGEDFNGLLFAFTLLCF